METQKHNVKSLFGEGTGVCYVVELANLTKFSTIQIQDKNIERVTKFSYLGVMLLEQLKWNEHIDIVCAKETKCLGLLSCIRSCLTLKASKCVYNCLIQPIFSYTDQYRTGRALGWL